MTTLSNKVEKNQSPSVTNDTIQKKSNGEYAFQFVDNRPETLSQRKLIQMANSTKEPLPLQMKAALEEEELLQGKFAPIQKQELEDEELLQGKFKTMQRKGLEEEEEEEELQMKAAPLQKKENNTGLPDNLKSGIENLSGYAMDDVKVHYNSNQPAQLNAHAYAQGTDIHLAPGQEKHLPHEAWHVVQQKQGRVRTTRQLKGKVNVNDDVSLEKEADVMGKKLLLSAAHLQDKETLQYKLKTSNNAGSQLADFQENKVLSAELFPAHTKAFGDSPLNRKVTPERRTVQGIFVPVPLNRPIDSSEYSKSKAIVQTMKIRYGGMWIDINDAEDELDFHKDPKAFIIRQRLQEICQKFYDDYGEEYELEIDRFYETNQKLQNFPELNIALQTLDYLKEGFVEQAIWRMPIVKASLGLKNEILLAAVVCYKEVANRFNVAPSMIRCTGSSGGTVTFIPDGTDVVVQFYVSDMVYQKLHGLFHEKLDPANQPKSMAGISEFWPKFRSVVVGKVKPVADGGEADIDKKSSMRKFVQQNANELYNSIARAIMDLHKYGLSQGDVRLDNVGQRLGGQGEFVLFDFNQLRQSTSKTLGTDLNTLKSSFINWIKVIPKMQDDLQDFFDEYS